MNKQEWVKLLKTDVKMFNETREETIDLRGASLSDANLSHADLRNADLRNADLSGVDLSRAIFRAVQGYRRTALRSEN